MADHTSTITFHTAREPGALDGWDATCNTCGPCGGFSIKSMTEQWAREHKAYMEAKDAREQK